LYRIQFGELSVFVAGPSVVESVRSPGFDRRETSSATERRRCCVGLSACFCMKLLLAACHRIVLV